MRRLRLVLLLLLLLPTGSLACVPSEMGSPLWKDTGTARASFARDRSSCLRDSRTHITAANRGNTRPSQTWAVSEREFRDCMEGRGWKGRFWRGFVEEE